MQSRRADRVDGLEEKIAFLSLQELQCVYAVAVTLKYAEEREKSNDRKAEAIKREDLK